jgi:hypothetical protein
VFLGLSHHFYQLLGDNPKHRVHDVLMSSHDNWIQELSALAASSPQIPELSPLEIGFDVGGKKMGINLLQGRVTDGAAAQCWVAGSDEVLADLVRGGLTLQKAHNTGKIQLSGEPEGLLRLAFLLDAAHALRSRSLGRPSGGVPS